MNWMNRTIVILVISVVNFCMWSCESDINPPEPPIVITEDVTNISNTSAVLKITVNGGGWYSYKTGVIYSSTSNNPNSNNGQKIETSYDSYDSNVTITNLAHGTTYYYKAYITNGIDHIYQISLLLRGVVSIIHN